jgi:acetyl/propionyl-CoA carboxylase alpha subunit
VSKRLVVANRGEIARRILRAGRERGYRIAVVSTEADREALARAEADEVLEVSSFLDGAAIVAAARGWGANLLHPGYGFLAENAEFAARVEAAGIAFVGPTPENMRALGAKEPAKALAASCRVPTLSALSGTELQGLPDGKWESELAARQILPPYLVKASGGGGGRGMRLVASAADLPGALRRGAEEAREAFGDPTVFVERYLKEPRHIEIQVFGDGAGGGIFLGERECSLQRRHQKVVEETPSPVVNAGLREAMGRAALALVEAAGYRGAGTVEFLVDGDGEFHFLEVNTRLQVEHPITEMVYGVDLVQAQLDLAEGHWPPPLPDPKRFVVLEPRGAAIEARVLAEDPQKGFLPTPGPLLLYREPAGEGIRVDSGYTQGGAIPSRFDSLIAKVIAWGPSRSEATSRLDAALERTVIHGPTTNLGFLQAILRHPDFHEGRFSTEWLGQLAEDLGQPLLPAPLREALGSQGFRERLSFLLSGGASGSLPVFAERFAAVGNQSFRVGSRLERPPIRIATGSEPAELTLGGPGLRSALGASTLDSSRYSESLRRAAVQASSVRAELEVRAFASRLSLSRMALTLFGETLDLDCPRHHHRAPLTASTGASEVKAPMAGKVLEIGVREGQEVDEGQVVFVVESMKMQLEVRAPVRGRVEKILVSEGQFLAGPEVMARLS